MMSTNGAIRALMLLSACGLAGAANAQSFEPLGSNATVRGVNADGSLVVGSISTFSGDTAFFLDTSGFIAQLTLADGASQARATAASDTGFVVVGEMVMAGGTEAFRWTPGGGMVGLGDLPGGDLNSGANDVSADGSVIVGDAITTLGGVAFIWNAAGGMQELEAIGSTARLATAVSISADASRIVGRSSELTPQQTGYVWDSSADTLPLVRGDLVTFVNAISGDGMVAAGAADTTAILQRQAWFDPFNPLGTNLPRPQDDSVYLGVNGDGTLLVGETRPPGSFEALIVAVQGRTVLTQSLADYLTNGYGIDLQGWILTSAKGISDDGTTIIGSGIDSLGTPRDFVVRLPGKCGIADLTTTGATIPGFIGFAIPNGVVDLDDLGFYLSAWLATDTTVADLTTSGATIPGFPGYAEPDGVVDLDDLGYFLNFWLAGCN